MLSEEERARVCVVLVRARNPDNIGAVARAMHGFGFSDLRLVNEYSVGLRQRGRRSMRRRFLLRQGSSPALQKQWRICKLVVGTTAVGERKREHPLYALAEGGVRVHSALGSGRVALLFGSEKTGLSNDALSHCHWLITIPMHQSPGIRHASDEPGAGSSRVPL